MASLSKKHETFISNTFEEADLSPCRARHGCVAAINGKIIARGHNNYRQHSYDGIMNNPFSCHAEMDVLRKCLQKVSIETEKFKAISVKDLNTLTAEKVYLEIRKKLELIDQS